MEFSLIVALPFLAATFVGVHAQNISQCILICINQSATANGYECDPTNTQCLCTNANFQEAVSSCLQNSCTAQAAQDGLSLLQSECAGGYQSLSISGLGS
ncbi:hypothetical protein V8D89_001399, partial [Ganoderma adspersum]